MSVIGDAPVVYRGVRTAQGVLVFRERGTCIVSHLRHVRRHSPGGFEWGYGGSGPADLARSLLIDVLGERATCPVCGGHLPMQVGARDDVADRTHGPVGDVCAACSDLDRGRLVPVSECDRALAALDSGCCDDGYAAGLPYQDFKFDVVARLPEAAWTLAAADIHTWLTNHNRDAGEQQQRSDDTDESSPATGQVPS